MRARKTVITVPEILLAQVDRAARERGESRTLYITRVLEVAVRTRRDEITRKLGVLFANEAFRDAQVPLPRRGLQTGRKTARSAGPPPAAPLMIRHISGDRAGGKIAAPACRCGLWWPSRGTISV